MYSSLSVMAATIPAMSAGRVSSVDPAGNLQSIRYGNGVTNLYQYDSLNRLTNLVWATNGSSGPLAGFAYRLKAGGTRTNLVESVNSSSSVTCQWAYDNLYRLTNEIRGAASVGYQYDAVGNRLARTSAGTPLLPADNYTYDLNDEVLTNDSGNFGNDFDGSTTGAPNGSSYGYDAVDRMTLFDNLDTISYDGDGNRIYKEVFRSGTRVDIYYLVDDRNPSSYPQVVEEYQTATNLSGTPVVLSRAYNYGLALISQQQFNTNTLQPSTLSYYGYDGHGSVRFLTGANGAITDTYTYDAYGTLISTSGSTPNNYLYCGQQYDSDFGLYYNRARYLSTDLGRFWTMDTYAGNNEDPLSLHKYLYCQGNPVNESDPTGRDSSGGDTLDSMVMPVYSSQFSTAVRLTQVGGTAGTPGSDVTARLNNTLNDIEAQFNVEPGQPRWDNIRNDMIKTMSGQKGLDAAEGAWDIIELAYPSLQKTLGKTYTPPGLQYGTSPLWPTIGFKGKCYFAYAANYAMWGKIWKLVAEFTHDNQTYSLDVAMKLMTARSIKEYGEWPGVGNVNYDEKAAFTKFGYDGKTDPSRAF